MTPPDTSLAAQPPATVLQLLGSRSGGLSEAEARHRLQEFGPNRVEAAPREPLWLTLAREFTHFFALILWLAAALALVAERFDPGQGMLELALAIVGVIVVNGVFSFWQAWRAEAALAAATWCCSPRATASRRTPCSWTA